MNFQTELPTVSNPLVREADRLVHVQSPDLFRVLNEVVLYTVDLRLMEAHKTKTRLKILEFRRRGCWFDFVKGLVLLKKRREGVFGFWDSLREG